MSTSLSEVRNKLAHVQEQAEVAQQQEEENKSYSETGFTMEQLQEAWLSFTKQEDRPMNLVVLKAAQLSVHENTIGVALESNLQVAQFKKMQINLRTHLAKSLKNDLIRFEVKVADKPKEGKRLYTQEDKFEYLAEKYPALTMLKNTLGLDWKS